MYNHPRNRLYQSTFSNLFIMKHIYLFLFFCIFTTYLIAQPTKEKFKFAFLTDIHLNKEDNGDGLNGLKQALNRTKELDADFIITGGDHVDVTGMTDNPITREEADNLYTVLKQTFDSTETPYYPTIGNHDRYWDKKDGFVNGDELFKTYFKRSYYSFKKNGVHFFVLNSVQSGGETGFLVNEEQVKWIKNELKDIHPETPIVISTHVPFYSLYYPVVENRYVFVDVISNYKELLKTFEKHNLKIVLQGHQHIHEEIKLQGVQFLTGGAVSAAWWNGSFHGTEEGFLLVEVDENNKFSWEYIDYGWSVQQSPSN